MYKSIDLEKLQVIARDAGSAIMKVYEDDFDVEYKKDNSPITVADKIANGIICNALQSIYPNIPILSEENKNESYATRKKWDYFWCIDPIDGTKEFINKNGEFTINIALIYQQVPVVGVVYAPALNEMYSAKKGCGAFKNGHKLPLVVNEYPEEKLYVVASKSHLSIETQEFIEKLKTNSVVQVSKGSSLKLCMVAEGSADIYPRLAPTMEWDTAAADAIVRESGKMSYIYESNSPLLYNKENLLNPWFIVR